MAAPVRITFLGGLGEIGRNCAAFEVDDRIMLLDRGKAVFDGDPRECLASPQMQQVYFGVADEDDSPVEVKDGA